jgi:hypothetical protein
MHLPFTSTTCVFRIQGLLAAVCSMSICIGVAFAQDSKVKTRSNLRRAVKSATPKPAPAPRDNPTPGPETSRTPSGTPHAAQNPTSSLLPTVTPFATPSNPTKVDLWGAKAESSQGFAIFFVLAVAIVGLLNAIGPALVAWWLKGKLKETSGTAWWVVPLVCVSFLVVGILVGVAFATARSAPVSTSSPSPSPTPQTSVTIAASPGPTSSPSPFEHKATPSPSSKPTTSPSPNVSNESSTSAPSPTPFDLSITDVQVEGRAEGDRFAEINDTLIIKIKNLKGELDKERTQPARDRFNAYAYVLFLDDVEIKKLYPTALDPDAGALHFRLGRTAESADAWNHLLTFPTGSTRTTKASIGFEGKAPIPNGQNFVLHVYRRGWLIAFVIFLVMIVGLFIVLGQKTGILREAGWHSQYGARANRYSLARVQLAWWIFIIIGSISFLAAVTWNRPDPGSTSLVLLALSSATALSAALMDQSRIRSALRALDEFKKRRGQLMPSASNTANGRDETEQSWVLAEVNDEYAKAEWTVKTRLSHGFVSDISSDLNGVSLFRLQLIVWTIVMGFVFVISAVINLKMPEFGTFLLFTGMSMGIYLIFKSQETPNYRQESSFEESTKT